MSTMNASQLKVVFYISNSYKIKLNEFEYFETINIWSLVVHSCYL